MKKTLLAGVALLALGIVPALAADLPARTYPATKAPVAGPGSSWAGFYIGAMGGYARENADTSPMSGGFAGGTLGYNWQSGAVVFGIETDAAWANVSASAGIPGLIGATDTIRDWGTVRGRLGYAFNQFLFYGTGGYAWADNRLTVSALGLSVSDSHLHSGWTAGGGVEVMFAPNWSVKAEYLYRSFSSQTYFAGLIPPGVPSGSLNVNSGQVGVNYHF